MLMIGVPPYRYNHIGLITEFRSFLWSVENNSQEALRTLRIKLLNLKSVLFTYLVHQVPEEEWKDQIRLEVGG